MGDTKDELIKEACEKFDKGEMEKEEYQVYPTERPDWYKEDKEEPDLLYMEPLVLKKRICRQKNYSGSKEL